MKINDIGGDLIYPQKFDSWTIYSPVVFIKTMDKSAFINRGSGIPKSLTHLFGADSLKLGEKIVISATHQNKSYKMRIEKESNNYGRVRIFWNNDFENLIANKYPEIYRSYKSNIEVESTPEIRFFKIAPDRYEITFIDDQLVAEATSPDEADFKLSNHIEGGVIEYYGRRYERDPKCRKIALEVHGTTCKACGFNFLEFYGPRGEGFIEIHHIKPLFLSETETVVNPLTDMVPLCSNCHRMIHRDKQNTLSINELKSIIINKFKIEKAGR